MNKRKSTPKLNRTHSHRKAMLTNMAVSLFEHERIVTTRAKGKALRRYAEPLITLARSKKSDESSESSASKPQRQPISLHHRQLLLSRLRSPKITKKLIDEIAPRFANRPGGYLRIIHLPERKSDASQMSIVELVDRREKVKRVGTASQRKGPKKDQKSQEIIDQKGQEMDQKKDNGKKEPAPAAISSAEKEKKKIKWYNRIRSSKNLD